MTPASQQPPDRLPADFFIRKRHAQAAGVKPNGDSELAHKQASEPAGQTDQKSGQSTIDVIRGSSDIPLSQQGRDEAKDLAQRTKGQFDRIYSSTMARAKETAETIAKANPKAGKVRYARALTPWFLGQHEGQPTEQVIDQIHDLILKEPNKKVPGRGKKSTRDGQSFNSFRRETLAFVRDQIDNYRAGQTILDVTHYRDVRLVNAWVAKGMPRDLSIDTSEMVKKGDTEPGDLYLLDKGKKTLTEVQDASKPGIYFARHGATEWNVENRQPTVDVRK